MSKNNFTPGPWFSSNDERCIYAKIQTVDGTYVEPLIAQCSKITTSANANAALIAAAPEMFEALENSLRLLEAIERETGYVTTVTQRDYRALINKVRGE